MPARLQTPIRFNSYNFPYFTLNKQNLSNQTACESFAAVNHHFNGNTCDVTPTVTHKSRVFYFCEV